MATELSSNEARRQHRLIAITLGIVLVPFFTWQIVDPGSEMWTNVNLIRSRAHAPIAQSAVSGDARFNRIHVAGGYTGNSEAGAKSYGCLLVHGSVSTQEDLDSLRSAVMATNPPVDVRWDVRIEPE